MTWIELIHCIDEDSIHRTQILDRREWMRCWGKCDEEWVQSLSYPIISFSIPNGCFLCFFGSCVVGPMGGLEWVGWMVIWSGVGVVGVKVGVEVVETWIVGVGIGVEWRGECVVVTEPEKRDETMRDRIWMDSLLRQSEEKDMVLIITSENQLMKRIRRIRFISNNQFSQQFDINSDFNRSF